MDLVSIIVPAYNAEKYIKRCIESLLSQNYRDIEIIIVDDSSTDTTFNIIEKYAKQDPRIKCAKQDHAGPNGARKKGLQLASGKYIMFVDADDSLERNAVEKLIEKISVCDVEIVRFDAKYSHTGDRVSPILDDFEEEKVINHEEIMNLLLTTCKLNTVWMQFYKREIFDGVKSFDSGVDYGEDFLINLEIFNNIQSMLVIRDILYEYNTTNDSSITRAVNHNQMLKNTFDRIYVSCEAIKFVGHNIHNKALKMAAIYYQLKLIRMVFDILAKDSKYDRKQFLGDFGEAFGSIENLNIDREKLRKYIDSLGLIEKIRNRRFILALLDNNCRSIWRYACRYRFYIILKAKMGVLR